MRAAFSSTIGDRQQHVRDQTPRAAGPPRTQHLGDPVHTARARPPPRAQRPRAVRAVDLPGHQPQLDPNLISLYRDQRCLRASSTALPQRSSTTYGGRAVVVFSRCILQIHGTVTTPTRRTSTHGGPQPAICNLSDGRRPARRHPERRSTNTKIRLITRIAFGFKDPDALIALAMLSLGGYRPPLPGRN